RWYEAQLEAFTRDSDAVAHESAWQQRFDESAPDALTLLDNLARDRNVSEFGSAMALWSARSTTPGFNGFSGQMLLNQLVKRADDERALADLLVRVLARPADLDEASHKLTEFVDYIE